MKDKKTNNKAVPKLKTSNDKDEVFKSIQKKQVEQIESEKTKRTAKNKKKRMIIYIIIAIVSIYIGYTVILLIQKPTSTFTVEEGKLYNEETNVGYIIRDEQVIKGENYKNGMEQIKAEGEKAAKDESVFRYYSKNENTLKEKVQQLDNEIQEIMATETGVYSSDIKIIENQIDDKIEQLRTTTDVEKMTEYKKEIGDLVTKKAKIAGELSPKGSYLKQLIDQRSQYEEELNSGAEYIKAPESGIVSYKVDGLEEKLTPESFESLTSKYLEELDLKTGKIIASNEESGKIINSFSCYIATITDSENAKQSKIDDRVKLRFSGNEEVKGNIVHKAEQSDGKILLVIEFNTQISQLTSYRKISFDLIWWVAEGLKVPNESIVEKDGLSYVVRNRAGYLKELLVKVEKQNDKYSIVQAYSIDELRKLGFSDSEINSYSQISIYDEILLNPDLEKVN